MVRYIMPKYQYLFSTPNPTMMSIVSLSYNASDFLHYV